MGKHYFRIMFTIYFAALAVCGVLRIVMKLGFIDHDTGFYAPSAGILPVVFYIAFAGAAASMLLLNRLRRVSGEYPVQLRDKLISVFRIAAGASILAFTWLGLPEHFGQSALFGQGWELVILILNYVFGALSGLSFIISGLAGLLWDRTPNAFLMIFPSIWQIILLLSRFNGYFSILYISDNLLIVLFMVFATLFYLGHARTLCGIGRKDGRNYVIFAGLSASLCGLLSSMPNLIYMLVRSTSIPVAEISFWECIYTFILSLYALLFVISYSRSIKRV